ncbi:MAG TPA: PLP-dependent aminotransferase family protein [Burkholderiaceae bacterium]|nr:PLP-dependent aminotransferase family protein [Burkholderiaceae bacterium]
MELHIVLNSAKDLCGQLYRQLREGIQSGHLAAGSKLPPTRVLAEQLGVSRKTVSEAYGRLRLENFLNGQAGRGTFVRTQASRTLRLRSREDLAGGAVLRRWEEMDTPLRHPGPEGRSRYEYIGGGATKSQFPLAAWRRCVLHALRESAQARGFYTQAEGMPVLREAIARHVAFSRGVKCSIGDMVVTNGAQQALDLVARVLVEPGCTVAVEDPGYPPARMLFASQGAQVHGVPVDEEGVLVAQIPSHARLIYVTPSHQFPLGIAMSLARRRALLERARAIGAIVIEDDYDSEFRYQGKPVDTLQSMDEEGIVAYVGTFSKVLLPELRLGYVIAPPAIRKALVIAKHLTDWHSATTMQLTLAKFIDDGYLQKHIRRCHGIYAARREKILARFAGDLSPWLEAVPSSAGFHLTALFRKPVDLPGLLKLARRLDVGLYSLDGFYRASPPPQGLIFGFGGIESLDIDPSLDLVRDILLQLDRAGQPA